MTARNNHRTLENKEIHPPKDFGPATGGDTMRKNLNDSLSWDSNPWKIGIINLVDINAAPPTEVDKDRYIVIEVASTVANAGWDNAVVNQIVEYDTISDNWGKYTPIEGDAVYDNDSNTHQQFNGSVWVVFAGGGAADFSDGGEAGGADRTLGNTDNFDLGLITNNLTRIHIQNDGKIGVGTTTPTNLLHLLDTTTGTDPDILIDNSGNGNPNIRWELSGSATGVEFDWYLDYLTNNFILGDNNEGALMTFNLDETTLQVVSLTTFENETDFLSDVTISLNGVLRIPANDTAAGSNELGEIRVDTVVTDYTDGVLSFNDGSNLMRVVAVQEGQHTSPVNGDTLVYSASNDRWQMSQPSFVGMVEATGGMIEAPSDKTFILDQSAAYAYDIDTLIAKNLSGTLNAAIQIDGTPVTGINTLSVSSVEGTGTGTALNSVAIGQTVTMVITGGSTPVDYSWTLKTTRT